MKIKTSELTDAALDWAVAKCESKTITLRSVSAMGSKVDTFVSVGERDEFGILAYIPSANWAQGGPIIEREDIFFSPLPDMGLRAFQFREGQYLNIVDCWPYKEQLTRLVLGMRCYVASKLGDEVEVPEGLL